MVLMRFLWDAHTCFGKPSTVVSKSAFRGILDSVELNDADFTPESLSFCGMIEESARHLFGVPGRFAPFISKSSREFDNYSQIDRDDAVASRLLARGPAHASTPLAGMLSRRQPSGRSPRRLAPVPTASLHRLRTPRAREDPPSRSRARAARILPWPFESEWRARRALRRARDPRLPRVRRTRAWLLARPLRRLRPRSSRRLLAQTAGVLSVLWGEADGRHSSPPDRPGAARSA